MSKQSPTFREIYESAPLDEQMRIVGGLILIPVFADMAHGAPVERFLGHQITAAAFIGTTVGVPLAIRCLRRVSAILSGPRL